MVGYLEFEGQLRLGGSCYSESVLFAGKEEGIEYEIACDPLLETSVDQVRGGAPRCCDLSHDLFLFLGLCRLLHDYLDHLDPDRLCHLFA